MFFYYILIATIPFHADPRLGMVLFRGGPLVLTPVKIIGLVAAFAGLVSPRPSGAVIGRRSVFLPLFLPLALVPPLATLFSGLPMPTDAVSQTISALLLYVTTRSFVITRDRMVKVARALVLAFAFGSLWAYKQHFLEHAIQAWGLEGEANYEALTLLPSTALGFWMARSETTPRWRRIGLGCAVMLTGALFLTKSRAGLIAALTMALVAIIRGRQKLFRLTLLITAVALLFAFGPQGIIERFHHIKLSGEAYNGDEQSTLMHLELAAAGLRMIEAHPFFGIGLNQFEGAAPEYNPDILLLGEHRSYLAHDTFLQMGAEGGLPTLLLFVSLIILGLRNFRIVERVADPALASLAVALEAGLIGISVAAFSITVETLPFWLLISLSLSLRDLASDVTEQPSARVATSSAHRSPCTIPSAALAAPTARLSLARQGFDRTAVSRPCEDV